MSVWKSPELLQPNILAAFRGWRVAKRSSRVDVYAAAYPCVYTTVCVFGRDADAFPVPAVATVPPPAPPPQLCHGKHTPLSTYYLSLAAHKETAPGGSR